MFGYQRRRASAGVYGQDLLQRHSVTNHKSYITGDDAIALFGVATGLIADSYYPG
jgi:hypothetical protein